jgi:hypothetical protein
MNTITDLDPLANDRLGQRLNQLSIATPAYPHGLGAVRHRSLIAHRRLVRRGAVSVLAAMALSLGNGVAAYFFPAYAAAIGSAPIISAISQPALDAAGLSAGQIRPINETGSLNGVTATLAGGYADAVNTTLFLQLDGISKDHTLGALYLTDQFGQRYALTGGLGIGGGAYPSFFQPLRGAAAQVGARLTLHVNVGAVRPGPSRDIQLHATLLANSAKRLANPPSIVSQGNTYSVLGLEYSSNAVQVHTRVTGQLIDTDVAAMLALRAGHTGSVSFPGVYLVDPSGRYQTPIAKDNHQSISTILEREHALDETRIFTLSAPGVYRIVVSVDNPGPGAHPLAEWTIRIS